VERQRHAALAVRRRETLDRPAPDLEERAVTVRRGELGERAPPCRRKLGSGLRGCTAAGVPRADRRAPGCGLVVAAGMGEIRDADSGRGEEHYRDCQEPAARVGAHPAPTGVECAAARRDGARCEASSKPAYIITRPASCATSTTP